MNTITFNNITKRYDTQLAVDNFSLTIKPGLIYGLLGPNGAGKSTLINMLCGVTSIDKGDILIGERSVKTAAKECKKLIGYVPQEIALFEELTVMENLSFFAGISGLKGNLHKEQISEALKISKLEDSTKKKVSTLSGGMKRRLNIACAMMHHPEILIMDEPTVGIDPQSRNHILSFVKDINKERSTTIIYTSHYMEEIETLCDEITIIDEGKTKIEGTLQNILNTISDQSKMELETINYQPSIGDVIHKIEGVSNVEYRNGILEVSHRHGTSVADIFATLQEEHVTIRNIRTKQANLEEVFLYLTGKQLRDGE